MKSLLINILKLRTAFHNLQIPIHLLAVGGVIEAMMRGRETGGEGGIIVLALLSARDRTRRTRKRRSVTSVLAHLRLHVTLAHLNQVRQNQLDKKKRRKRRRRLTPGRAVMQR